MCQCGKSRIHGFKPSIDSGFARVDLLSATDKANNDSPIRVAIHARNQELRLGVGEPRQILSSPHEARGLLQVPRALRLVEDHNMFRRRAGVEQCIVAKVMNVLDESFDTFGNFPLSNSNAIALF